MAPTPSTTKSFLEQLWQAALVVDIKTQIAQLPPAELADLLTWMNGTRPDLNAASLNRAYQQMAQDEQREAEARTWAEATLSDVADEPLSPKASKKAVQAAP